MKSTDELLNIAQKITIFCNIRDHDAAVELLDNLQASAVVPEIGIHMALVPKQESVEVAIAVSPQMVETIKELSDTDLHQLTDDLCNALRTTLESPIP